MLKPKKWMGEKPTLCQICKKPFMDFFMDGKTVDGPWGLFCIPCHEAIGCGLGQGYGQKYNLVTLEKVAG